MYNSQIQFSRIGHKFVKFAKYTPHEKYPLYGSLQLDNGDNITSVIIENIEFSNCYTCIYMYGIDDPKTYYKYYLLNFSMTMYLFVILMKATPQV